MKLKIDTVKLADEIYKAIGIDRLYWNRSPQKPTYPYAVYYLDTATPTEPSTDYYLNVNIFDDINKSTIAIETTADQVANNLDNKIILTDEMNCHLVLEQRQFISSDDLITSQMINLRFVARVYFTKKE